MIDSCEYMLTIAARGAKVGRQWVKPCAPCPQRGALCILFTRSCGIFGGPSLPGVQPDARTPGILPGLGVLSNKPRHGRGLAPPEPHRHPSGGRLHGGLHLLRALSLQVQTHGDAFVEAMIVQSDTHPNQRPPAGIFGLGALFRQTCLTRRVHDLSLLSLHCCKRWGASL